MTEIKPKAKGLTCPNCGAEENYKSHNCAMKRGDGMLNRVKICLTCNKLFRTYEVVVGPAVVKTRKKVEPVVPAAPAAPVVPVAPVAPVVPVAP